MIQLTGKLEKVENFVRGQNFEITEVTLNLGSGSDIPVMATAAGRPLAPHVNALLGNAPEGSIVEMYAVPEFRENRNGGDAYMNLSIVDALLLGSIGSPGGNFRLQGFIKGFKEVPRRDGGVFEVAQLQPVAFNRQGDLEATAVVDISLNDEQQAIWRANIGQFVFVRGSVTGNRSNKGGTERVWPRFTAGTMTISEPQSWLQTYSAVDAPEAPVATEEVDEGDINF